MVCILEVRLSAPKIQPKIEHPAWLAAGCHD
jgi:hypothetical protein